MFYHRAMFLFFLFFSTTILWAESGQYSKEEIEKIVSNAVDSSGKILTQKVKKEFQKLKSEVANEGETSQKKLLHHSIPTSSKELAAQMEGLSSYLVEALKNEEKVGPQWAVAVLPFENKSPLAEELKLGETVMELLLSTFSSSGEVTITDRQNMKALMEEMTLATTGMIDDATAVGLGNLVGAKILVTGNILMLGKDNIMIVSRLTDIETGVIIATADIIVSERALVSKAAETQDIGQKPVSAAFRSFLIPGWGQFENGHNIRGGVYTAAAVISIGGVLFSANKADAYDAIYKSATNKGLAQAARDDRDEFVDYTTYSAMAYGGVVAISVIDAVVSTVIHNKRLKEGEVALVSPQIIYAANPYLKSFNLSLAFQF